MTYTNIRLSRQTLARLERFKSARCTPYATFEQALTLLLDLAEASQDGVPLHRGVIERDEPIPYTLTDQGARMLRAMRGYDQASCAADKLINAPSREPAFTHNPTIAKASDE